MSTSWSEPRIEFVLTCFTAPSTRGNIRYVNAKFINTADFDLIIFPDRGEHQKAGYQLEAHSSTLLEYVLREGPLPVGMNFRLQNKKNGEQLILNGKYDFHVISSDDKQVVKEYRILPGKEYVRYWQLNYHSRLYGFQMLQSSIHLRSSAS